MFNRCILIVLYLFYPLGFNMHIYWVDPSITWFPHWAVHFTAFDGCSRAISTWWVPFSVTTLQLFYLSIIYVYLVVLYLKEFIVVLPEFIWFLLSLCALSLIGCPIFWWVYRLDISEEKFIRYFWWCWNRLKVNYTHDSLYLGSDEIKRNNSRFVLLSLSLWIHWKQFNVVECFAVATRTRLVMMYQCRPTLGSLHC